MFNITKSAFLLLALLVAMAGAGCSGGIPSMSGGPAPIGIAEFGTWLKIATVSDGSKIESANIDVVQLKNTRHIVVEVKYRDDYIDITTVTRKELLGMEVNTIESEVSIDSRSVYNGADGMITLKDTTFYLCEGELVLVRVRSGEIRINHDPNKTFHISTKWSLTQVEEILGPATSKNLPGLKSAKR